MVMFDNASILSLFLLATMLVLIYPLKVLLTEKVIKPVQAIHEELSVEEVPKAKKRRKGKKPRKVTNDVKKKGTAKSSREEAAELDAEDEGSDSGKNALEVHPTEEIGGNITNETDSLREVGSISEESEDAQTYEHSVGEEAEEEPITDIVVTSIPVKLASTSIQTEEEHISTYTTELISKICRSNFTSEQIDEFRKTFSQSLASKFGPDKTEAAILSERSKLKTQVENMKANMTIAVAVIQKAKQMQEYFKTIENRYLQNVEKLQDKIHKLCISKANLEQKLIQKSDEIERLKQLDSQNRLALQRMQNTSSAISSASITDLEFYKSECNRLKAEYTSASDLMRAQDLEIQQLRSLANTNKIQIDELKKQNSALKQAVVSEKQYHQQEMISSLSNEPSLSGQAEEEELNDHRHSDQTSVAENGSNNKENSATTVPAQCCVTSD